MAIVARLRSFGTLAIVVLVGVLIVMILSARVRSLQGDLDRAREAAVYAGVVQQAIHDTLVILPEEKHPAPDAVAPEAVTIVERDTVKVPAGCPDYYLRFKTKDQWDHWFGLRCTGTISGRDSTIWQDGRGALVDYSLDYGTKSPRRWMVISPIGKPPPAPKGLGWRAGLGLAGSSRGSVAVSGDVTWRGWGPTVGGEFHGSDKPVLWLGIRREF